MVNSKGLIASFVGVGYRRLARPILFLQDPEKVHDRTLKFAVFFGKVAPLRWLTRQTFRFSSPKLKQTILGINFPNPVGLAGGFDKNAQTTSIMPAIGFGFMEVGSITAKPYAGNSRPRLVRLKKSKSILVNYGLANIGARDIAKKLRQKEFPIPVGTNIAKTNSQKTVSDKAGVDDYYEGARAFSRIGAFYTINVSCPNAFGGQPFHEIGRLEKLLTALDKIDSPKPIFLKISPDLSRQEVDDIISIVKKHRIDGFVCTNLAKDRRNPNIVDKNVPDFGGFSGKIVEGLANDQIAYIYKKTRGKYVIIGCGGIFNAEDAYKKIRLGANLVQLITGMIYEGPQLVGQINRGLINLLERDGFSNISEAIGADIKTKLSTKIIKKLFSY
jgi:dihydroorotate dehydrogenase